MNSDYISKRPNSNTICLRKMEDTTMRLCHKTWTVDVESLDNSEYEITRYEESWKCTRYYTDTNSFKTPRKLSKESFDLTECLKCVGFPMSMDNLSMLADIIGIQLYSVTAHDEYRSPMRVENVYVQYFSVGKIYRDEGKIYRDEKQSIVAMNQPSIIKFIKNMDDHIGYINDPDDSKVDSFAKLAVKRFYKLIQNSNIINDHHCYIFIDDLNDPNPDRVQINDNYSPYTNMNSQNSSAMDTADT